MIVRLSGNGGENGRRKRQPSQEPVICGIQGCPEKPTGNKPYCIEHLDKLPHAARLKLIEQEREAEEARALRTHRGINLNGSRCKEILIFLAVKGAQSPKRLAIEVDVNGAAIDNYVKALVSAKLVESLTLGSRRGTPRQVVTITSRGKASVRRDIELLS